MANKVGVIESVDTTNKIVNFAGYGEYLGEHNLPSEILEEDFGLTDMEVTASKILLDSGREVWASGSVWYTDEENMKVTLEEYEAEGYTINNSEDSTD